VINPADLINALVTQMRLVPGLVAEVGGDPNRIVAYHDNYPHKISLFRELYIMPAPGILVAWQGTEVAAQEGGFERWQHGVSVYLKSGVESSTDSSAYYRMFRAFTKGIPAGGTIELQYATIHPACNPMNTPSISRQPDEEGIDFFEIATSFTEIGDE
jgi:hypothetical protein